MAWRTPAPRPVTFLTKLTYLGLCCRMNTDAYLQQIGAAHLGVADVAVAFSHSGCSMDTVKALKLAQKAGLAPLSSPAGKLPSWPGTPTCASVPGARRR